MMIMMISIIVITLMIMIPASTPTIILDHGMGLAVAPLYLASLSKCCWASGAARPAGAKSGRSSGGVQESVMEGSGRVEKRLGCVQEASGKDSGVRQLV